MISTRTDPRALNYDPGQVVCSGPPNKSATDTRLSDGRLRVADVMKAPAPTIDADAPILEVIHRLVHQEEDELVVTVGGRPDGIITSRQVISLLERDHEDWRARRAIDLARDRAPRLLPNLALPAAARALTSSRHDALPVVDYRGDLIGLLAHRHLVAQITHGHER